jgi:hypothetical protein
MKRAPHPIASRMRLSFWLLSMTDLLAPIDE